jgi:hypothetical protein
MNDARIKLTSDLQFKWFDAAMKKAAAHRNQLNNYDRKFLIGLEDGFNMVGRELTITVKQMNHLRQMASELEKQHG